MLEMLGMLEMHARPSPARRPPMTAQRPPNARRHSWHFTHIGQFDSRTRNL